MKTPLYLHPDGFEISHDLDARLLKCSNAEGITVAIPIGTNGLISLGLAMIEAGHSGSDLTYDLLVASKIFYCNPTSTTARQVLSRAMSDCEEFLVKGAKNE